MLRSGRNFGGRAYSARFASEMNGEKGAIQSAAEDCDINTIVRRFGITGNLPVVEMPPMSQVFPEVFDFQEGMNAFVAAQRAFLALPANIRDRFGNDPAAFLNFVEERDADGNRVNIAELRRMKLALPEEVRKEPPVMKVEVINPVKD